MDSRGFLGFDWTLSLSHHGAYLNIDDILSTNERFPCRAKISIPKVSHLLVANLQTSKRPQSQGEDSSENDIPSGMKLEIPFWLLFGIGGSRRQVFSIDLPIIYRESYREVLAADPWIVDLRKKCPYFYSLGCHLSALSLTETPIVLATVENVFQRRIRNLIEAALNANKGSVLSAVSRLEELEQALFRMGKHSRGRIDQWFSRLHERLEASRVAKTTQMQAELAATESMEPQSKRQRRGNILSLRE